MGESLVTFFSQRKLPPAAGAATKSFQSPKITERSGVIFPPVRATGPTNEDFFLGGLTPYGAMGKALLRHPPPGVTFFAKRKLPKIRPRAEHRPWRTHPSVGAGRKGVALSQSDNNPRSVASNCSAAGASAKPLRFALSSVGVLWPTAIPSSDTFQRLVIPSARSLP